MGVLDSLRGLVAPMPSLDLQPAPKPRPAALDRVVDVASLPTAGALFNHGPSIGFTGEKFHGGMSPVSPVYSLLNYWELRERSSEVFNTNLYGRGLIRRLVTNEINTGLHLEAQPVESVLGMQPDALLEWSEDVERRFELWAKSPKICDAKRQHTFGQIQATIRREALVGGDVLVVMTQHPRVGVPQLEVVDGRRVRSPLHFAVAEDHDIFDGVEVDAAGVVVAYHVDDHTSVERRSKRIAAEDRNGRRVAWLVYGTDRRVGTYRGEPLLSIVLQSLKEIDRYRDSAQRKAVINSILAMFIRKVQDKPGTLPLTGGAVRKDSAGPFGYDNDQTVAREYQIADAIPGMVLEELQQGEEPVGFKGDGTDVNFPVFEEAVIRAIAWAMEIPPEIMTLGFSSNYSASQAALHEFNIYLARARDDFGEHVCAPVYADWLLSEVLRQTIRAPRFEAAYQDPAQFDITAAWLGSTWLGAIKPTVDPVKQVKSLSEAITQGFITRASATRMFSGRKYSQNVRQLIVENEQLAEANKPMAPPPPVIDGKPADESDDEPADTGGGDGEGDPDNAVDD